MENKSITMIASMLSSITDSSEAAYEIACYLVHHKCVELNNRIKEALNDADYCDVTVAVKDDKLNVYFFDGCCGETSNRWFNSHGVLIYDYYDHGECCYGHRNEYDDNGTLISHEEWGD